MGVGPDPPGLDREALVANNTLAYALPDTGFEQLAKQIAVRKPAVPVLRNGRIVQHRTGRVEVTEPAIGEVQQDLLASSPHRANAEAITDQQRADHQLGIDRRPADRHIVKSYAGGQRPDRRMRSLPPYPGGAQCRTLNILFVAPPALIMPRRLTWTLCWLSHLRTPLILKQHRTSRERLAVLPADGRIVRSAALGDGLAWWG